MNHKRLHSILFFFAFLFLQISQGISQGSHHGGHFNPDSLTIISITGTTIIDSSTFHPTYFIDENGDEIADFILNFGPYWYQPDSGNASRPKSGDAITIKGGEHNTGNMTLPIVVVYEINNEFWRDPYTPTWANLGSHFHGGGHHQNGFTGFAFGWMHDSLKIDTINGTAVIDTTFIIKHYYLDETGDGRPDYFLNFGPPWYEPLSGASRPDEGDQITIVGGILEHTAQSMIVVFEINGLVWRDSLSFGSHFGGGWFHKNMVNPHFIHAPFDTADWMMIHPGWHQGGHHGQMMPDSLFGQMLQLFPQNMPNNENQNIFAGYEIGMFFPDGMNGMWQGGGGNHMNFGSLIQMQLHYNDIQIQGFKIDESTIGVKYWDSHNSSWAIVTDANIDMVNNIVTFSQNQLSNFIILTGETQVSSIENTKKLITDGFLLTQNYPNPFNPSTTIEFELQKSSRVVLTIYNVLGQPISEILNSKLNQGTHRINFNSDNLPSGIYFYELKVENNRQIRKMTLMR
jgi:hypothetical protein